MVEDYCEEADNLKSLVLELISESLGLEPSFLNDYFSGKSQQVLQVKDDEFVTVKPVEGYFVFNVGDQIEILSNGRYRSVEHRAFVSSRPRISIATFNAPADETVESPIPRLLLRAEEL